MGAPGQIALEGADAGALLDAKHRARERALGACRRTIQACAASIRAAHREEFAQAEQLADEAAAHLHEADSALVAHPDIRHAGFLHDAAKEYAEARIALAFVREGPLPRLEEVGVDVQAYLRGMAEAASELRRRALDLLRRGELEAAERSLGLMEEVYALLVTLDYPEAVTGGLRRTTDALRGVLERTRGDFTTALLQSRLQANLEACLAALRERP